MFLVESGNYQNTDSMWLNGFNVESDKSGGFSLIVSTSHGVFTIPIGRVRPTISALHVSSEGILIFAGNNILTKTGLFRIDLKSRSRFPVIVVSGNFQSLYRYKSIFVLFSETGVTSLNEDFSVKFSKEYAKLHFELDADNKLTYLPPVAGSVEILYVPGSDTYGVNFNDNVEGECVMSTDWFSVETGYLVKTVFFDRAGTSSTVPSTTRPLQSAV